MKHDFDQSDYAPSEKEASLWLIKLEADDLPDSEKQRFLDWLIMRPENADAFESVAESMEMMKALVGEKPVNTNAVERKADKPGYWKDFLFRPAGYALASLVAAGFLVAFLLSNDVPKSDLMYSTAIGEQQKVALEDGSRVLLNTASVIAVNYKNDHRKIELLQGEAYFEVEKSPQRPFTVVTPKFEVVALGTAFNVRLDGNYDVIVTEGTVRVLPLQSAGKDAVVLQAGESIDIGQPPQKITDVDQTVELAWHQGVLNFHHKTLQQAVTEFGRYSNIHFYVMDPELQKTMIGGSFKIGDTQAFMSALSDALDVKFERVDGNRIHILPVSSLEN